MLCKKKRYPTTKDDVEGRAKESVCVLGVIISLKASIRKEYLSWNMKEVESLICIVSKRREI